MTSLEFSPGSTPAPTPETYSGSAWRHIPAGGYALNFRYILHASGRWNRKGLYGALYLSLSEKGARAEWDKYRSEALPGFDPPRDLIELRVSVRSVLDLTVHRILKQLGISAGGLTADTDQSREICRSISDWARTMGFSSIRYPSAAAAGQENLVIFPDSVFPSDLRLEEVSRQPLNH